MTFENAVDIILRFEGGYVNDPDDPGGETNFGISKRSYPDVDIAALTRGEAKDIYRRDFWEGINVDKMPLTVRLAVFDAAVNHGAGWTARTLQRLVGADADGIIGPRTLMSLKVALDRRGHRRLIRDFLKQRAMLYISLPHFKKFGAHWMQRLIEVAILSGIEIKEREQA